MAKRRREDRSSTGEDAAPFASPFARLAGMKPDLPSGPTPSVEDEERAQAKPVVPARKVIVRRQSAGRGGKTVTVVERLGLSEERLHELAREMKKALGCGASVEGADVVLQGDQQERARAFVLQHGLARDVVLGSR